MASKSTKAAAQKRAAAPGKPSPEKPSSHPQTPAHGTGASFTMTGAATGNGPGQATGAARLPGQAAAAPAPAAASSPASNTVQPFLTDPQKAALAAWNTKFGNDIAQFNQNDTDAWAKYNASYGADQFKNAEQVDTTNQAMGARGIGFSSIRDNALNDLAVTLAQQQTALQTARDAALFKDQAGRDTATAQNTAEQKLYDSYAVGNAQAVPPTTTPASTNQTASTGGVTPGSGGVGLASPNTVINTPTTPRPSGSLPTNMAPAGPPRLQPASSHPQVTVKAAKTRAGSVVRAPGITRGSGGSGI